MTNESVPATSRQPKSLIYTIDSFANGVSVGRHAVDVSADLRDLCELKLHEDDGVVRLRSRYSIHRDDPLKELESALERISRQGVLGRSQFFFGAQVDPFFPFEGKFDASMRFLELFQKYTPGHLTIQTRSPLVVIALPVLKRLGKNVSITVGIETPSEDVVARYTPGYPRVAERLKTAAALRRFGIEVAIQVSPVLPYGDWRTDAPAFAELLDQHADYISVQPMHDGKAGGRSGQVRSMATARRLAQDRMFYYLRPDSAEPLTRALEKRCSDKLNAPARPSLQDKQLSIFAA